MATAEASATPVLASVKLLFRDILDFVRRPLIHEGTRPWTRLTFLLIACVIAIDLAVDSSLQFLLHEVDAKLVDLPDAMPFDYNLTGDILSLLILAPIVEEAIFRGWLSGHKASLRFALWGSIAFGLILLSETERFGGSLPVLAIGAGLISAVGFVQWLLTFRKEAQIPSWFSRNFRWFVWGGALVFSSLHLVNYEAVTKLFDMVLIIPGFLGALLLAFTRVRFGLRAAIAHHFAYNFVYMLAAYL